jgi:phosphopantothenoylcysteine decarboxylase/phosphopantothenate--cysteine ligase
MRHLTWAEEAQAVVIAPCTAHTIAKITLGLADNLLGSLLLAAQCPVILAPAMDGGMWDHPAVQSHVATLRARGVVVLDPEIGPLASGRTGQGRLPEEPVILDALIKTLSPLQDFAGERVLVSAGPTQEPIDPVRYLSNRSTGKMGYAVAEAAAARGAEVVLVTGPTTLTIPTTVQAVTVTTAEEMHKVLTGYLAWSTIVIMAAAVADFRPALSAGQKIKKDAQPMTSLELEPTVDILSDLSRRRTTQFLVGFAAETQDLVSHAQAKLTKKGLDLIVGNNVLAEGSGFGSDTNQITLLSRKGRPIELPLMTKRAAADALLDRVRDIKTDDRIRTSPTQ